LSPVPEGNLLAPTPNLDFAMRDPVFQRAYDAVRRAYTDTEWGALTPRQITEAIYDEIRRIDRGDADGPPPPKTSSVNG